MFKINFIVIISVVVLMAATSSCRSSRKTVRGSDAVTWGDDIYRPSQQEVENDDIYMTENSPRVETSSQLNSYQRDIVAYAMSWKGVPYRYGGNTRKGVDCSGFTCCVFKDIADIKLPRSSREQSDYCKKIDSKELIPGDLLFFTSRKGGLRINHVALYIGDNRIIHSTTSRGVIISSLDDDYWQPRLHHCGRVEALFR